MCATRNYTKHMQHAPSADKSNSGARIHLDCRAELFQCVKRATGLEGCLSDSALHGHIVGIRELERIGKVRDSCEPRQTLDLNPEKHTKHTKHIKFTYVNIYIRLVIQSTWFHF